ncbi:MAG: hypothetical protein NVS84_00005 [Candidatus Carsonella ruddii]|nr:MAG: hypothetical protein NVS84_00005 [Candidatus Carsonella ruddii]
MIKNFNDFIYLKVENEKIFLENKNNYLIYIKKIKKRIFFIKKKKDKNKNKIFINFFFFHNKYSFLLFFNSILNFIKKNTIFFYKNKIICLDYENDNIIIHCYKRNFYTKYFIKIVFIDELNLNIKKFFLINNIFFFFSKKNLIFDLNNANNIYRNIKKTNFIFLLINLKKKKKIKNFLKKNVKHMIFSFNNIFFIKKIKNNIFLKIKFFLKIGNNFSTYIDYKNLKKYFLNNKKILINYCNNNKFIIFKKYNFIYNKENYLRNLHFN